MPTNRERKHQLVGGYTYHIYPEAHCRTLQLLIQINVLISLNDIFALFASIKEGYPHSTMSCKIIKWVRPFFLRPHCTKHSFTWYSSFCYLCSNWCKKTKQTRNWWIQQSLYFLLFIEHVVYGTKALIPLKT